ncbi:hypothetical protein F3D3_2807 [Fusibacter sp. 3D3]|nr:hypothetical protein F3D3_2807 [Fusibacter sp. 3D3]
MHNSEAIAFIDDTSILWEDIKERAETYKAYSDFDAMSNRDIYTIALNKISFEIQEAKCLEKEGNSVSDSNIQSALKSMRAADETVPFDESPIQQYIKYSNINSDYYWNTIPIKYAEMKRYLTHLKYVELNDALENNTLDNNTNEKTFDISSTIIIRRGNEKLEK